MSISNKFIDNALLNEKQLRVELEDLFNLPEDDIVEINSRDEFENFVNSLLNYENYFMIENQDDVFDCNENILIEYLIVAA